MMVQKPQFGIGKSQSPEHLMQATLSLLQAGEAKKALANCKKLIKSYPTAPDPYHIGGLAAHQLGDFPQATRLLKKACRLQPDWVDAHSNLAIVYHAQGRFLEAEQCLMKALGVAPADVRVKSNLAMVLRAQGHLEEAEQYARQALSENPDFAECLDTLGRILDDQDRADEAEAAMWQAVEANPNLMTAAANLATFLESRNRLDRMPRLMETVSTSKRRDIRIDIPLAKYLRREKRIDEAIALLKHYQKAQLPAAIAKSLFAELGVLFDQAGAYQSAFQAFQQSNVMAERAASKRIKKHIAINRVEAMRKLLDDPAFTTSAPEPVAGEPAPVFLVGFPRSGTTLLEQVLDAHPNIQAIDEESMVVDLIEHLQGMPKGYPGTLQKLDQNLQKELVQQYWERASAFAKLDQGGVIVDKMPLNMAYAAMLWRLFPNAKYIFVLRHPMDVCLSCFMQPFQLNHAMANFLTINDTTAFYDVVASVWRQSQKVLPIQVHTIRYEDVVENLEAEARRMIDFLELPWDDAVLGYRDRVKIDKKVKTPSYSQVAEPVYKRAKGRWVHYQDLIGKDQLDRLDPHAIAFGYPPLT